METIKIQSPHNNKVQNQAFTVIEMADKHKYQVGKVVSVKLNAGGILRDYGRARIIDIKTIRIHQVNEYIARLESGLSENEYKNEFAGRYQNDGIDWATQPLMFMLLVKEKEEAKQGGLF